MSVAKPHSHRGLTSCRHPMRQTQELFVSPPPTPSAFKPQLPFSSADNSPWNPLPLPITCLIPTHPSRLCLGTTPPEQLFSPPGEVKGVS